MNALTIKARSMARRVGLLEVVKRILPRAAYEARFGAALLAEIREGDVVWDVGANVGFYTRQMLDKGAVVVAFEPVPSCRESLARDCQEAVIVDAALSDKSGPGFIAVDATTTTSHLETAGVPIRILAGDDFDGPRPDVVKIDVEGFEEEVLEGMGAIIADHRLRALFIEVHFGLLANRGKPDAPIHIERRLRAAGFAVSWFRDGSHLKAYRYAPPS